MRYVAITSLLLAVLAAPAAVSATSAELSRVSPDGNGNSHAVSPAVSANGRVFAWNHSTRNDPPLSILDLDGSGQVEQPDLPSFFSRPRLSADGRYVAGSMDLTVYLSRRSVVVFDRETSELQVIEETTGQTVDLLDMSPDARFFLTEVRVGDQRQPTAFVHDRETGTRQQLLPAVAGAVPAHSARQISADGRYVLYFENYDAQRLRWTRLSLYDRELERTIVVVPTLLGRTSSVSMSDDAAHVALSTRASHLSPLDADSFTYDLYLWERVANRLRLLTPGSNGDSDSAKLSGDGRVVAFRSTATTLVPDDRNGAADVFLMDLVAGSTRNLTPQADSYSLAVDINQTGSVVAFTSAARNLDGADENGFFDVYAASIDDLSNPAPPCSAPTGPGVWRSASSEARLDVVEAGGCDTPGVYSLGRGSLHLPARGFSSPEDLFPGAEPGTGFDELVFYRRGLANNRSLYAMSFVDDTTGSEVDMRFVSSSSAPREFQLLELLVDGRNVPRELRQGFKELDTRWTFTPGEAVTRVNLGGRVFVDQDDNGVLDSTEAGLARAFVTLHQCGDRDGRVDTKVSEDAGDFDFPGLEPGSYQFEIGLPANRRFGRQLFSDDGELESLIRVVVPRTQPNGDRFERGYSDCVRYDSDSVSLSAGVLP